MELARDNAPAPNPAIGVVNSPGLISAPLHAPHHHAVQAPRSIQAVLARHNRAEASPTCAAWQRSPLQSKAPLGRSRPQPILRAFTGGICRGLGRWIARTSFRKVWLLRPAECAAHQAGLSVSTELQSATRKVTKVPASPLTRKVTGVAASPFTGAARPGACRRLQSPRSAPAPP